MQSGKALSAVKTLSPVAGWPPPTAAQQLGYPQISALCSVL